MATIHIGCCGFPRGRELLSWCRAYDQVYCLFNNVSMWEDALRLHKLLCQPVVQPAPIPGWVEGGGENH